MGIRIGYLDKLNNPMREEITHVYYELRVYMCTYIILYQEDHSRGATEGVHAA